MADKYSELKLKIIDINLSVQRAKDIDITQVRAVGEQCLSAGFSDLYGSCTYIAAHQYLQMLEYTQFKELWEEVRGQKGDDATLYSLILENMYLAAVKQDFDKSLKCLQKAHTLVKKMKATPLQLYQILYLLGVRYHSIGKYQDATRYLKASLKVTLHPLEEYLHSHSLKWLGIIHNTQGDTQKAIKYFLRCEPIYIKYHIEGSYADMLNACGLAYFRLNQHSEAIERFHKSLQIAQKMKLYQILADVHNNLGMIYQRIKDYPLAEEHYLKSLDYRKVLPNTNKTIISQANLGGLYTSLKKYDIAIEYLLNALELTHKITNISPTFLGDIYGQIIANYLNQNDIDNASIYIKKLTKLMDKVTDKTKKLNHYKLFSAYHKALNQYKKSLDYAELAIALYDECERERVEKAVRANQ